MIECGEDLPFVTEASEHLMDVDSSIDQLDRHSLLVRIVGTQTEIHGAHAAGADLADDLVAIDLAPARLFGLLAWRLGRLRCSTVVWLVRGQQRFDFGKGRI